MSNDPFGFGDRVREAEESLVTSTKQLQKAQVDLAMLNEKKLDLQSSRQEAENLEKFMERILRLAQDVSERNVQLQRQLVPLKSTSNTLVRRAKALTGDSDTTRAVAVDKQQIVCAILKICKDALELTDTKLGTHAKFIREHIIAYYGGPIPTEVEEDMYALRIKLKGMGIDSRIEEEILPEKVAVVKKKPIEIIG